jgi:peptidoglycan/xylan/chitin deacetylase (PgdA/CDA1 family)
MGGKITTIRKQRLLAIRRALVSMAVLAIFILPLYGTGVWIKNMILGSDPRKVVAVEPMQVRDIDRGAALAPFAQPILSVTFDDGWLTTYTKALPMLQKYGIPTTQYILSGVLKNPLYMSEGQIRSMQQAGHEVGSHTVSHPDLTALDDQDLQRELTVSRTELQKRFGVIRDFASPLGAYDDRTLAAIGKLYRSQRNTAGDPGFVDDKDVNLASNFNPLDIMAYTVRATTTKEDLQRLLDYTIAHNGWLVLTYHQVGEDVVSVGETYGVLPAQLQQQFAQLSHAKVRMATMGKVLDAIDHSKRRP